MIYLIPGTNSAERLCDRCKMPISSGKITQVVNDPCNHLDFVKAYTEKEARVDKTGAVKRVNVRKSDFQETFVLCDECMQMFKESFMKGLNPRDLELRGR